jgi:hypothetical protein
MGVSGIELTKQADADYWGLKDIVVTPTLTVNGNISLSSLSTLISQINSSLHVYAVQNGDPVEFNVTSLWVSGPSTVTFKSTKPIVIEGNDYYSSLILQNQDINLNLSRECLVIFTFADNRSASLEGFDSISISASDINLAARTPQLTVFGEAKFAKCKIRGVLFSIIGAQDRDVTINGTIKFKIALVDNYKIVEDIYYIGVTKAEPAIVFYDYTRDFINNLPLLLAILAFVVIFSYICKNKTRPNGG